MTDIIIIGAGVVGSAVAYYMSRYDLKIVLLEKENDVAVGTSRANSAIIHAGFDPDPKSLMAKLNVEGSRLAKDLAETLSVPYKQNGALVVAFDEEDKKKLKQLYQNGIESGVEGVEILSAEELFAKEKNISPNAVAALYAPTSAIINPWEYTLAMAEVAAENGVEFFFSHKVCGIEKTEEGYLVKTDKRDFKARYVINCAGVDCEEIHSYIAPTTFTTKATKGEYYLLDKDAGKIVSHTIFQCPRKEGKGVLVSPTVHGNLIVGPNASVSEKDDVTTTAEGLEEVKTKAVIGVPDINFRSTIRTFAGVRANTDKDDFIIEFAAENFIDVAGIKSPGLSAAPAIALYVIKKLRKNGLVLYEKENFKASRNKIVFKELDAEAKNNLIKENPKYGRIICRCESITEGEIEACFSSPIPPVSTDGIKRRVNAGMGRCQGGFCLPRVVEIAARMGNIKMTDVIKDKEGSRILTEGDDIK